LGPRSPSRQLIPTTITPSITTSADPALRHSRRGRGH
jgi:hypothetical protein